MSRDQYTDGELIVEVLREIRDELKRIADGLEPQNVDKLCDEPEDVRERRIARYKSGIIVCDTPK